MSEEKKVRTMDDIQKEYTQLAAKAGHVHFQVTGLSQDLELISKAMKDLNLEAAALQQKEAATIKEGESI